MSLYISPADLHAALQDGDELALIDIREQGVFFDSHLFWAVCIPLSRLELQILDLVPRPSVRIVLCDDGPSGIAGEAMEVLDALGYSDVRILEGGTAAWAEAGYELYSGVNVPSKAFGEFVEHAYDTPRLPAQTLDETIRSGRDMVILDSRPVEEYRRMNIPGGIDVPGAELVYRVHEIAPDPETLVVVNCAGRTRSIIGAQSLINAGIPNEVAALKDGTMGWELAGFSCEHGSARFGPEPSPDAVAVAQDRAAAVARRFDVPFADKAAVEQWQAETGARTLYLLDVRTPEEFEAGHVAGARHAPGGQLVQATDEYVATRHARIVLFDDEQVRAVMTASWLIQLGWRDVHVYGGAIGDWPVETGPRPPAAPDIEVVGYHRTRRCGGGRFHPRPVRQPDLPAQPYCRRLVGPAHPPRRGAPAARRADCRLRRRRPAGPPGGRGSVLPGDRQRDRRAGRRTGRLARHGPARRARQRQDDSGDYRAERRLVQALRYRRGGPGEDGGISGVGGRAGRADRAGRHRELPQIRPVIG